MLFLCIINSITGSISPQFNLVLNYLFENIHVGKEPEDIEK